jgi:aminoacrylate hydrolase
MARVNSGGVEIVYDVMNAGSPRVPVMLIAGLNGMRQACMQQAIPLSRERPVIVHDQRGTGQSAKPRGVYSVRSMARDVVAIMDDAGIARAHLVGTSTGGAIAQVLCIDYPERVQSAAICCSWMKCDHFFRRQFEMRKRILLTMGTEALMLQTSTTLNDPRWFTEHYEELLEREKGLLERAGPPQIDAERIDAIMAFDESERLGRITAPVAVIGARNDAVCPPYCSEQLAAAIPGAMLHLYEDGGHFFYVVYADRFNDQIRDFMGRHEQPTDPPRP